MDRCYSERLFRRFGFEKGLGLLNVLTARDLGMIPDKHARQYLRENIQFFTQPEAPTIHPVETV
jgi:hypothetical protein